MPPNVSIHQAQPRIAVIGGGISGLAAAHRITELLPNSEVVVFEASNRLGGVLETVERDGFLVERSADSFTTKFPWALELCRRLGLSDELIPTDESRRRAMVVRNGRLIPVPDGFFVMSPRKLWPMLTTPALSLTAKVRLLIEPLMPPKQLLETEGASQRVADESVESFVCRRLGREVFERLVQPLLSGIYTADAAKLSMAATMPEFLTFEREHGSLLRATLAGSVVKSASSGNGGKANGTAASGARYGLFVAPRKGLTRLIEAITNRLPVDSLRLGARVTKIKWWEDKGWGVTVGGNAMPEHFDGLIIALPAYAAAELIQDCNAALATELAAIPYASCAVVSVALRASQIKHAVNSFGFVVPKVEGRRIIAASFSSAKFPGRAPHDGVLIRAFVGGALQPELLELADNDLMRLVVDELNCLLDMSGEPLWFDIARWPRSMPQYHVGHLTRVERIERLASDLPGFALAGNAYGGVGIPQCIRSGESAAEQVARAISSRTAR